MKIALEIVALVLLGGSTIATAYAIYLVIQIEKLKRDLNRLTDKMRREAEGRFYAPTSGKWWT